MYAALLDKDKAFDGVFFVGVKTTGIFCRPSCPARKPLKKNVLFFASASDSLDDGYRACKRCRPLETTGQMPGWLRDVVDQCEQDPSRRWSNRDIAALGVEPTRVCRWFTANLGITFQRYMRARRLASALSRLSMGDDMTQVAFDSGYESVSGFRDAFQKIFGITPGVAAAQSNPILINRILTPLGPMVAAADQDRLLLLEFADRRMLETQFLRLAQRCPTSFCPGENSILDQTNRELDEYFQGNRIQFDVPVGFIGTDFQVHVWQQLMKISFGKTTSYESIASGIGKPLASRAVGRANGDNRIAIIIPCHRVIRADGSISGYGGSRWRKEWLLHHEHSVAP